MSGITPGDSAPGYPMTTAFGSLGEANPSGRVMHALAGLAGSMAPESRPNSRLIRVTNL